MDIEGYMDLQISVTKRRGKNKTHKEIRAILRNVKYTKILTKEIKTEYKQLKMF